MWQAVKIAKNINISPLPKQLNHNNVLIKDDEIPDAFANYSMEKITTILNETHIDNRIYNGKRKINTHSDNFMSKNDVLKAVKALKVKHCEGQDMIPQMVLIDGVDLLIKPLSAIFNKIYQSKELLEQWLIAKFNPIFKKGNP